MKSQSALVGPERAVHLDSKPAIDLDQVVIVHPGHAKMNHPLRFDQTVENPAVPIFFILLYHGTNRLNDFGYRLEELRLVRITALYGFENFLNDGHRDWWEGYPRWSRKGVVRDAGIEPAT